MNYTISSKGKNIEITGLDCFNIDQIFDCGQTFRFSPDSHGDIRGVALDRELWLSQPSPDKLVIHNMTISEYEKDWREYLAIDDDYTEFRRSICKASSDDPVITTAMKYGQGIRILHQQPWETLCSFIVSQNNNIPRIKTIIKRLCEKFGNKIEGTELYCFPTAESLANAGTEAIFSCGTGFRAKYITDAAEKVCSGQVDLDEVKTSETSKAAEILCRIKGVGPKVAACSLLFGFGKSDAFPIDVWVKRVLAKYYDDSFTPVFFGKYAGLAQQYLFYYERYENSQNYNITG